MKKISTLVLLGLAFGSIQAAQISQSQALGVASKYVTVNGPQKLVRAVDKSYGGSDAPYYIFNSADGKGFVIVAGDDQLTELVGYSKPAALTHPTCRCNCRRFSTVMPTMWHGCRAAKRQPTIRH